MRSLIKSRLAVQLPEHNAACQVPKPEAPESCPRLLARFNPLDIVTLILPPSPTRPDASNVPPAEASCRFSIAIVKLAPLAQFGRLDEIRTFQWPPERVDASAGEVEMTAHSKRDAA